VQTLKEAPESDESELGQVDAPVSEAERSLAPFPRYTAAERFADPLGVLAAYQRWLFEARRRGFGPP
jgi:hypothetical protein